MLKPPKRPEAGHVEKQVYEVYMTELRANYTPELLILNNKVVAEADVSVPQMLVVEPGPKACAEGDEDACDWTF